MGQLNLPQEDLEVDMFHYIINSLKEAGYDHYEISNFCRPGYESRHNLMYWDNAEYYGLGAGASGYLNGVRYRNHGPIRHYLNAVEAGNARVYEEKLSLKEQMEEELFLGLRKRAGVSIQRFEQKFQRSFEEVYGAIVAQMLEEDLLIREGDRLRTSQKGLFLGDTVAERFILE